MGCHSTGNIAPFSLTTYEQAKSLAGQIASTTQAGTMPPFAVRNTDECTTRLGWKDDIHLSDEEIATLEAWNKAGAPKGDPKDAPPAFVPKSPDLPGKNFEIQPKTPHVTSGDKDEFRCFVIDPGLTEDRYLNGLQIVPGNHKVVHHALIFVDPTGEVAKLAGPDGSFSCGAGDVMVGMGTTGQLINAWAPGTDPIDLPAGVGGLIPKGSLVMMQIHYHPGGVTADPDSTRIQLRLDEEKPKYGFLYRLLGNFEQPVNQLGFGLLPGPGDTNGVEFLIPADSPNHVETLQFTIPPADAALPAFLKFPEGSRVYGQFNHMHYLGFDQKVTLTRANAAPDQPAEECLVHTPQWEFSWQRSYTYDAPLESLPTLDAGDVLKIRCTYNNTKDNPYVQQALQESHMSSTIDVKYGEGNTFDEMCMVGLSLVYPMP
ncbi:hypothetical protein E8A73_046040 [Polyangium aurulentum]|nr:hypothetical protein E8A73_046040 [Polyangium aurulentum]